MLGKTEQHSVGTYVPSDGAANISALGRQWGTEQGPGKYETERFSFCRRASELLTSPPSLCQLWKPGDPHKLAWSFHSLGQNTRMSTTQSPHHCPG